jgi:hypothetical protein
MKKPLTILKDWGTLVAFCTMIVIGIRIMDKLDTLEKAAIESQAFQEKQGKANVKTGMVVEYVLEDIMGLEIPEEDGEPD